VAARRIVAPFVPVWLFDDGFPDLALAVHSPRWIHDQEKMPGYAGVVVVFLRGFHAEGSQSARHVAIVRPAAVARN
jgi:hypothetical protein